MPEPAIIVNNISKSYRLGVIGRQTLQDEVRYWWHKVRGRNPLEYMGKIGQPATSIQQPASSNENPNIFWALKDISFTVQPGEVLGIIGRNGAGKTTLLKVLTRITEPTSGTAIINGRVASLLEVGTGFHPELTGRENIFLNGSILGMKKDEITSKFNEIVDFAEIHQFIDTPVKRYSSGMYVRLAFAVAAHLEPEILVIDEVLAVGDAAFQKRCLTKMSEVGREGRTVLFVSHNMPAVLRLCTRCILLDNGYLKAIGPTDEIVDRYMQGIAEAGSNRIWKDDDQGAGDDVVRLLSASLINDIGEVVSIAEIDQKLFLQIRYRTLNHNVRFRCAVTFNTQGVCAFTTMETFEQKRKIPGIYLSTLTIPPNLLAENEYVVNISIFSSRGVKLRHVAERNVLAFRVVDSMHGGTARGDYAEGYAGVVRPLLKWDLKTEF